MVGNLEEILNISKNNIEAAMKSFGVLPKTAQAIAVEMTEYSKRSFENGTKAIEKLFAAKSFDKAVEVQSEYANAAYEDYTAQVTKLSHLYAELANEAFKPYAGLVAKTTAAM
jgi:hypothetical protein